MKLLLLFVLVSFYSCESADERNREHVDSIIDDLKSKTKAIRLQEIADSMGKRMMTDINFDTIGVAEGPIRVLSAELVRKPYSNYKNIFLKYKNVSSKTIEGIRFKWYGVDAFGEPSHLGSLSSEAIGFGLGETDEELGPNKTASGEWEILSEDGKKILKAWAYEVAFSDGTKWSSTRK